MGLRQMVQQTARTPAGRPWGIGSALTDDTDAWVWSVIHSWGGGLASLKGDRVELATPQSAGAFSWLAETFGVPPWREAVHAHGAVWSDTEKNEALVAGETAYTFSERLLPPAGALGGSATAAPDLIYLPMPAGPASRPRAIAGSVTHWVLPRGAAADPVERFLEALLQPEAQRRVWRGGGGLALPAFTTGWDDPQLGQLLAAAHPAAAINARRFRQEQTSGGYVSATGNAGGETAASQATGEVRLGAWMLRQVLEGRQPADVLADASRQAIALFRDFGLLGA
jgi:ABC-type glycerol-3-phosphate transport system substrate-binding protein